jgi:Type II secretion system (T2SS), protein G
MRRLASAATFSLLFFVSGLVSAQIQEQSQSHAVALGVRDAQATFNTYMATFIVKDPAGQQHRVDKLVAAGSFGYVHFPNDFNARPRPGRHRWVCFAGGRVAARGVFDYDHRGGFTLVSDAGPASATDSRAARIVKAEADTRVIEDAVHLFHIHTGRIPATLGELTRGVQNDAGVMAGPFLRTVPSPPTGWSGYAYRANPASGTYSVSATGDGTQVQIP